MKAITALTMMSSLLSSAAMAAEPVKTKAGDHGLYQELIATDGGQVAVFQSEATGKKHSVQLSKAQAEVAAQHLAEVMARRTKTFTLLHAETGKIMGYFTVAQ